MHQIQIEPGNGNYDLRVERGYGNEFVEVKTPGQDTSLNFNWWNRQASEMNKKYSNSPDVSTDQAILEVPVKRGDTDLDSAQNNLQSMIETPPADDFSEVRIQVRDTDGIETLSIATNPEP